MARPSDDESAGQRFNSSHGCCFLTGNPRSYGRAACDAERHEAPVPSRFDTIGRLTNSGEISHHDVSRLASLAPSVLLTAHPIGLVLLNIDRDLEDSINRILEVSHARLSQPIMDGTWQRMACREVALNRGGAVFQGPELSADALMERGACGGRKRGRRSGVMAVKGTT